jgi:hypothetical protein
MSKSTKFASTKPKSISSGIPFVVVVGIFGLGLVSYVISQMLTAAEAHPSHLTVALIGAVLGGLFGWLWYHWRGDII